MPKLKVLSGAEVVGIFKLFCFHVAAQKESHVKLRRILENENQTLTIPNHKELDRGTLRVIYAQAQRYIPNNELREYFFTT